MATTERQKGKDNGYHTLLIIFLQKGPRTKMPEKKEPRTEEPRTKEKIQRRQIPKKNTKSKISKGLGLSETVLNFVFFL